MLPSKLRVKSFLFKQEKGKMMLSREALVDRWSLGGFQCGMKRLVKMAPDREEAQEIFGGKEGGERTLAHFNKTEHV